MRSFSWIVMTNCALGTDDEFNKWYDEIHIPDLLRIPGVVAARRSKLADTQLLMNDDGSRICGAEEIGAKYRYMAIYEIENVDPTTVLKEVTQRSGTEAMYISPTLIEAHTTLFENF